MNAINIKTGVVDLCREFKAIQLTFFKLHLTCTSLYLHVHFLYTTVIEKMCGIFGERY